jgi:hypothetical protein
VRVVEKMSRNPQLPKIVFALSAACRFTGRLYCGQQERHENSDDGNYHEEFDQRKTVSASSWEVSHVTVQSS